ncbi:MAG: hypothetical protein Q7T83_14045 [Thermodesulfovibrionales bacterium]|nr:hypothetical protein [Thermodesulfovibrionales bacterium]
MTMTYNPDIHHRRSIRIRDYDYSQAGAYFVTVCAKDRVCLFGDVVHGKMALNEAGCMVSKWWHELTNKFSAVETDEFVIMPNHFHGIILIVGADLCVCPPVDDVCPNDNNKHAEKGEHTGSPLHRIIQWVKTMTTNEYIRGINKHGWERFNGKLWQRNYYEHIIRDEKELNCIREYIINNPLQWAEDENNPVNIKAVT